MNLDTIWQDYRAALKGFLQSRVSNEADVEDLLQDILLKSYRNLHTLNDNQSIKPWLFQIANHVIIDFYRKKARANDLPAEDLWYEKDTPSAHKELAECLTPFINALPQENAELLNAVELGNIKQKDYAQQHGIEYSTLKSRVQKSRKMLREIYEDCCDYETDIHGNIFDYHEKPKHCDNCEPPSQKPPAKH